MGQKEIFEGISEDDIDLDTDIELPKPAAKKKAKRVLSDERKAQLREQLKKGRETSLANRKKKALVKSAEKEIKKKEDDKKIAKAFLEKDTTEADELKQLREEMKAMKEAMKAKKAEPKNEKIETDTTNVNPNPAKRDEGGKGST